jgi:hypothetical protein
MVLEYNSHKPFSQQNGFGVQLTELNDGNGFGVQLTEQNWKFKTIFTENSKPLSTYNGFGVQLTETISTAKWFWRPTHGNHFHCKMVLEYNSQKPFPQQNGFETNSQKP